MNCKFIKLIVVCLAFLNVLTVTGENKRKLVWADEFNYTGLPDTKKWSSLLTTKNILLM